MACGEVGFEGLKKSIRTASSRKFGASRSKFDRILFAALGCFAAVSSCVVAESQSHATRLLTMTCAMAYMLSFLSVCRTAVPFVLQVSYADMLRIRRPFYIWMLCVSIVICLSDPFLDVLFGAPVKMLPAVLTVVSVGQALGYFREGRSWHLFLAFAVAGVAVGLSAFGFGALALLVAVTVLVQRRLTGELENGDGFADETSVQIMKTMVDPYVQMMLRMVSVVCFLAGMLTVGAVKLSNLNAWPDLVGCEWTCGLSLEGLVVILAVGVIPLVFALDGIGKATDTMNVLGFGSRIKYVLVGCTAVGYLLMSGLIRAKMHVTAAIDVSYWMLAGMSAGFSLMLSAVVALVDIWSRMPLNDGQFGLARRTPLSRWFRWTLLVLPVALAIFAGCIRFCVQK